MPLSSTRHRHALAPGQSRAARRIAALLLSGLSLSVTPGVVAQAQNAALQPVSQSGPHAAHIAEAAQRFGIPEHWIRAVIRVESAGDPHAVSSTGAIGLMQIMPDTWDELRARHGLGDNPFQPHDNILAGTAYLREMLDRYGNSGAMLAAYNAGPGRYDEYLTTGRTLPAETRAYVAALGPVLSGDPLPASAVAAMPPVADWRKAPLFLRRRNGTDAAPELHREREATGTAFARSSHGQPHASAPSRELFVVRSIPGGTP